MVGRKLTDKESREMLEREYDRAAEQVMKNLSKVESFVLPSVDGEKIILAHHQLFKGLPEEFRNARYSIYYTDEG